MAKKQPTVEELFLAASEKLRQTSYAPNIKKYKPHEKQYIFHSSTHRKKLYIGGNRSGKTTAGVTEGIWRATNRHPYRHDLNLLGPTRGRVIGVDFTNGIDKIIIPQYKQWLYPSALRGGAWETAYEASSRTLYFANQSTIEFMSYDQDIDKFAGTSRHWVHFDEEPPHTIYNENMARLIDTHGDFWLTMTPLLGMTWVYDELYEPYEGKEPEECPVHIVEIDMMENPYLNEESIADFRASIDDDEAEQRITGKFVKQGGLVYKNFDPTVGGPIVMADEPDIDLIKDWYWQLGLDHGLNNPTAVLWVAWDKNGFGIVFDEWYRNELSVDQHAKIIRERFLRHGREPTYRVADPSIANRNATTMTSTQEEYQKYGLGFTLGNNDVKSGVIRVKRYFNPTKYVGHRSQRLIDAGIYPQSDVFPRLRISPRCVNLIRELKGYRWKTYQNKKLQYENNPYDEPHKKDDHACDALRYIIMSRPDLKADNENLDEILDRVLGSNPEAMEMIGNPKQREIADPYNRLENMNGWNPELNSMPGGSGWEYDEHMGGIF